MSNKKGSEWNRWDLHVHTSSSYDYKYKGTDADTLLCNELKKNNIKAVAITDHFIIDNKRIKKLRKLAPEITFFPGVELRTDKGSSNLHLILIFSDEVNVDELSEVFNVIMLKQKAKSKRCDETIYWTFEDIIDFAKTNDALVSIHAGRKENGIDKEITNAMPVKEAIKSDMADNINFFEIGQKRDIDDYEEHVFKEINRKPLIICSDCHNPKSYSPKESLWIKSDITFNGLKQCLYQPQERVYIGVMPPMLDRLNKDKQSNIASISVKRVESPRNSKGNWFDFELPLNPGMVAIIGNKGSGKSALSDIVGHLCKCQTMKSASFLNENRFRKLPNNYSEDYKASITWADGNTSDDLLSNTSIGTTVEDAQYLPQKYIEDVCNDIGNVFQKEIDKVIFSYVDISERGDSSNLEELVSVKSKPLELKIKSDLFELHEVNEKIVKIESKKTAAYSKSVSDTLEKMKGTLKRHEKSRPEEIKRPSGKEQNEEYQKNLKRLNEELQLVQKEIDVANLNAANLNSCIDETQTLLAKVELLEEKFKEVDSSIKAFLSKYNIEDDQVSFALTSPSTFLKDLITQKDFAKNAIYELINNTENGLLTKSQKLSKEKEVLISTADAGEKTYQKYLSDISEWEKMQNKIIGDEISEGSLRYYEAEWDYINGKINEDYPALVIQRNDIMRELFEDKVKLTEIYKRIYAPVQGEITNLLGSLEDNITFNAEIYKSLDDLSSQILRFINQRFSGKFKGQNGKQELEQLIKSTDFSDFDSVTKLVNGVATSSTEDIEISEKKIENKIGFYDFVFGLSYIGVKFKLKLAGRELEELSPGERGIVLLILYLALSKERKPIIIDQPEDNLDNQSIYNKLVPCICRAKKNRQVIIVTHNPNIAVASDAEQVVYCNMDKKTMQIRYCSGSIEDPMIMNHVVDVLEGTKPAFDLRRHKYNL